MLKLPNGCSCSNPSVYPDNWNKSGASIKKDWYIQYYFTDPLFKERWPNGKYTIVKGGVNKFKTLLERRYAIEVLKKELLYALQHEGYNPITKKFVTPAVLEYEISPDTPFLVALRKAREKLNVVEETKDDIKHMINGLTKSVMALRFDLLQISEVSRKHIRMLLDHCAATNKRFSDNRFNVYRSYLSMLFKQLLEMEAVEVNPTRDIAKRKTVKKLKKVLTDAERLRIDTHLKEVHFDFRQFIHLFFHSGARLKELMQVQSKKVDLKRQVYRTIIRKGKQHREVERTIKTAALPFWEFFLVQCKTPEDYLFGLGFKPASQPIIANTVTRTWKRLVKWTLGIDCDLYSLKHLNTTEVVTELDEQAAAKLNAHTSTAMVRSIYDVGRQSREHERLKAVANKFA